MALAGTLLSAGLAPEGADRCIVAVAEMTGDEEAGKRRRAEMVRFGAGAIIPRIVVQRQPWAES